MIYAERIPANVQEWVIFFQIIFWIVTEKMDNWFVDFTAAYTSNGRQRTAEQDLQEFLNKSPIATRSNEPDRLSSHLLRLFLQWYISLLYIHIQKIQVDRAYRATAHTVKLLTHYHNRKNCTDHILQKVAVKNVYIFIIAIWIYRF